VYKINGDFFMLITEIGYLVNTVLNLRVLAARSYCNADSKQLAVCTQLLSGMNCNGPCLQEHLQACFLFGS
jgi:hypothetical protein